MLDLMMRYDAMARQVRDYGINVPRHRRSGYDFTDGYVVVVMGVGVGVGHWIVESFD